MPNPHSTADAQVLDKLAADMSAGADADLRKLYAALIERFPDRVDDVRDAFEETVFSPHRWGSYEWRQWLLGQPEGEAR